LTKIDQVEKSQDDSSTVISRDGRQSSATTSSVRLRVQSEFKLNFFRGRDGRQSSATTSSLQVRDRLQQDLTTRRVVVYCIAHLNAQ